ncbi:hypothetical protein GGX14DRAFT_401795 [Mycena pura]|uniref:Uncharacterized protein n=1 Tax=Mycena pura TaxID=153505 RepID=A0AAD6Y4H2_9AGAR|nr:hypothetical protein GGX14DRAFT_401795 [Mycena pura]
MALSVLEALSILQPMEQNLAPLDLPAYTGDDETKSKKLLPKWLDGLASLLAGSSAGSRKNQVCALSLSLSQSGCDLTIAFNWTLPHSEDDARKLINTIWNWLRDVSALPPAEEDVQKNRELLATILEVSLDRIRRRFKRILRDAANLTDPQKNFLHKAALLHNELYKVLGPNVQNPDFRQAAIVLQYRVKEYDYALSQLDDLHWLPSFKSDKLNGSEMAISLKFAVGARQPALGRYMDKLRKPHNQYVLIWQVARKSFIRDALAVPLNVKMLTSPSPESAAKKFAFESMDNFETRVRSYLWAALRSYSPNSADDSFAQFAIDSFYDDIKESLDNKGLLPPLGVAHYSYLRDKASSTPEKPKPYPYIGVSKLSCFHQEDEAIRDMMGKKLKEIVGQLVSVAGGARIR